MNVANRLADELVRMDNETELGAGALAERKTSKNHKR